MFLNITKENITILPSGFLKKEVVIKDLQNNPFGKYLIYEEKGQILGYLYYSEIYDRIEINQFEVEVNNRNCGIGTKILKEFTKTVEKDITLEVKIDNMSAIHLYKKFGFQQCAIRKGYYQGIDGILMERKIR